MRAAQPMPTDGLLASLQSPAGVNWWPQPDAAAGSFAANKPALPPMIQPQSNGLLSMAMGQGQGLPSILIGSSPVPSIPGVTQGVPATPMSQPAQVQQGGNQLPAFDAQGEYDKIWQSIQPPKHKFNFWDLMGIIGPALMAAGGNQEGANAAIAQRTSLNLEHQRQLRALAMAALKQKQEDYARKADQQVDLAKPFTVGRDRVQIDPATGESKTLYHGPQDFEAYATAQGYQPGTSEYNTALQDFVLRSAGPTALDNSQALDDHRTGNRASLEGLRQGNRVNMEGLRQKNRLTLRGTPSYRDTHPLPGRTGGNGAPTATGPNGQKVTLINGQWVPVK